MYCNKCGKEIVDIHNFCTNCGNKLEGYEKKATIIFERQNQFYGVLIPIKIFIDGKLVESIKVGNTVKVDVETGKHRVAFDLWSGNGQYDIDIEKEGQVIKVVLKLGLGLVTSKPQIVSITTI